MTRVPIVVRRGVPRRMVRKYPNPGWTLDRAARVLGLNIPHLKRGGTDHEETDVVPQQQTHGFRHA